MAKAVKFDPKTITVKRDGLLSGAALEAESKALADDMSSMDARVQTYLLSEIVHIEMHRNVTRLNRFFNRVKGSGFRVTAMHAFIQAFANVKFIKPGKRMKHEANGNTPAWEDIYEVRAVRAKWVYYNATDKKIVPVGSFDALVKIADSDGGWLKFKPEPEVTAYNLNASLASFIKGAISKLSRNHKGDEIDPVILSKLTEIAMMAGVKVEDMTPANIKLDDETKTTLHLVVDNTKGNEEAGDVNPPAEQPKQVARRGARRG